MSKIIENKKYSSAIILLSWIVERYRSLKEKNILYKEIRSKLGIAIIAMFLSPDKSRALLLQQLLQSRQVSLLFITIFLDKGG